jgi:hypothetical protein
MLTVMADPRGFGWVPSLGNDFLNWQYDELTDNLEGG